MVKALNRTYFQTGITMEAAIMRIVAVFAVIALGLTVAHGPVDAAGTGSANKPPAPGADQSLYKGARAIEAGDYQLAVKYLKKAVRLNPRNADGFNFLGYSYRKLGKFDPAFENYEKALALDPNHLPANEYIGEAYLLVGELAKAQEHLAILRRLCSAGCGELDDLEKAVAGYKENPDLE